MRDWVSLQKRYLRDELPVRLGGLAANLARVKSFSDHPDHRDIVKNLLEESKFFIEWTAPDAGVELQAELVNLQIQLAHWELNWANIWSDPVKRTGVAEQARVWSERILEISGLLRL
jgi:hypothetical protein